MKENSNDTTQDKLQKFNFTLALVRIELERTGNNFLPAMENIHGKFQKIFEDELNEPRQ